MSNFASILYYSDSQLDKGIEKLCIDHLPDLPTVSVTKEPLDLGKNIVSTTPKSYQSLFEDILMGLEAATEEIVFFVEADILYHPNHFEFTPSYPNTVYYNGNYWVVRMSDGFAVHYNMGPLSGLCAFREDMLKHYRERLAYIKENGFNYKMGFEPFTHKRVKWKYWCNMERFYPPYPNLDLFHGNNLTRRKWSPDKFQTKPTFWYEGTVDTIPGWPNLRAILKL